MRKTDITLNNVYRLNNYIKRMNEEDAIIYSVFDELYEKLNRIPKATDITNEYHRIERWLHKSSKDIQKIRKYKKVYKLTSGCFKECVETWFLETKPCTKETRELFSLIH